MHTPSITIKNLIQLFERDPFPLWQYYLGELRGDIFNKASEIAKPGARIITGSDYDTPVEPLIEQLGWKTQLEN